ncbi:DUF1192 domain-containing protein [Sphingomonas sp. KR1UV-12]|uniref:DUF1192 domain-containing protein n=2 Tax=Sphingomonas aurea TaxID=3063994 RepID=A0ABT9EFH4_9SPHN|nr:DUF1192 domain-containing protein [Sphingomonas sp. KR1UV-12]MDP1025720.1 DUF1192 domain-containing protein [Sphingomonas sp. KR1UV-12]
MEIDDAPRRRSDTLAALTAEDLDPLSQEELAARVAALEAEIARTRRRMQHAVNQRASADALFRT